MPYRFCKPASHSFSAYAGTLSGIKDAIRQWNAPGAEIDFTSLDEYGEGWVRVNGTLYGYIDQGPRES